MELKCLLTWIVGPSTPSSPISFIISLWKFSCLLAIRTLGSSFSWNSKGTKFRKNDPEISPNSGKKCRGLVISNQKWQWRTLPTGGGETRTYSKFLVSQAPWFPFRRSHACWPAGPKTFLTIFSSSVSHDPKLMVLLPVLCDPALQIDGVLPDNSRGRHSWPSSHPRWADTPDWWRFYLTIVVEGIPDHLLVLCDPALQIDGDLPDNCHGRHSWQSSCPRWATTPEWWRFLPDNGCGRHSWPSSHPR